ncbi:hypothetical protein C0J52_08156 [Blattella germanica]|nr:hypothetical protein C0J52_08156 [Blattella germanica]
MPSQHSHYGGVWDLTQVQLVYILVIRSGTPPLHLLILRMTSPISYSQNLTSCSPEVYKTLKEALHETLNEILSPHHDMRIAAEERIQALEVTEDFGVHLAEFTVDPQGTLAIRQLASVLLKQYVEIHWCSYSERFRPPETNDNAKATIKELLPHGLKESISKVRSSVAYAISAIAHWDWPENWPGLFDILVNYLSNGNEWAVNGAMRVLIEFSRDVTDMQLPHIAPVILSEMYRIFEDEQKYSVRIRSQAVEVFTTCTFMISAMSDYNKGVTKTLLNPVLPCFSERFVHGLQMPNGQSSDSCLKTDIIKALTLLVKRVPKQMAQWLPQILPPVWQTLTQSADICLWTSNPNQFVEDEDEDTFTYSVRISAQDLLMLLCLEFEEDSCSALCQAVTKHVQESETQRNACNANWWKVHEACMLALGSVKDMVVDKLETGEVVFNFKDFLQNVVIRPPFLLGRCLWVGSRYAHFMSSPMIEQFLQATVAGLQSSQLPNIRISAVRAVWGFCDHLRNSNNTHLLVALLPGMMENLLAMATQYSCEILSLVLETLALVLSIDRNFTASCESKVTSLAIAVFLKYNSDPCIISLAQDIFKELSQNPACLSPLQQRLVPTLSGGECLRTYISIAPEQVCNHQDSEGHTGLWYSLQVAALLLNPSSSEYTATFVGRLIITLITKAGSILGENLDLLLKAVLSKMQRAETLSVIQVFRPLRKTGFDPATLWSDGSMQIAESSG